MRGGDIRESRRGGMALNLQWIVEACTIRGGRWRHACRTRDIYVSVKCATDI